MNKSKLTDLMRQVMDEIENENPANCLEIKFLNNDKNNMKLTKELALEKILEITELEDNESQHVEEDELYLWFIKSVSDGFYEAEEAKEIATIIRKVADLNFARWYA